VLKFLNLKWPKGSQVSLMLSKESFLD